MIVIKKQWFYREATSLGLQPALSLTKNVRTPNSVWGNMCVAQAPQMIETATVCLSWLQENTEIAVSALPSPLT